MSLCSNRICIGQPSACRNCGDGILQQGEMCDDSNKVSGDGCSQNCLIVEDSWECLTPGKACTPICGDQKIIGNTKPLN